MAEPELICGEKNMSLIHLIYYPNHLLHYYLLLYFKPSKNKLYIYVCVLYVYFKRTKYSSKLKKKINKGNDVKIIIKENEKKSLRIGQRTWLS